MNENQISPQFSMELMLKNQAQILKERDDAI